MTKIEFSEKVSKIAEKLTWAGIEYCKGNLSAKSFKAVVTAEMEDYPYDWYMADDIDEECAGLTRGEVYEVGDGEMWDVIREKKDFVFHEISKIENWGDSWFEQNRYGEPYFVVHLLGCKGLNY